MNKPALFNVITESWLPVRRASGATAHIRPAELAEPDGDDPIVGFAWGRADLDAASRELLIGFLAIAYAGGGEAALMGDWDTPPGATALNARLAPFIDAFNLGGDGPRFLQDMDELDTKAVSVGGLLIDAPGENAVKKNSDLFQKRDGIHLLSLPAAAIALFALQAFAPSGGAGHRTSLRGGGPLTTLARPGQNRPGLWHMLLLNTPVLEALPARSEWHKAFAWCGPTRTSKGDRSDAPSTNSGDVHDIQMLFGMPRRIRLDFTANDGHAPCSLTGRVDEVAVNRYRTAPWGTNYGAFLHPLSPYYRQKDSDTAWLPAHPQPGGITYRHWPDIVFASTLRRPAAAVLTARRRLMGFGEMDARILASGYDMDNMKARAFVETQMPLFSGETELFAEDARQLVAAASDAANKLARSVHDARNRPDDKIDGNATVYANLKERFFHATEALFFALCKRIADARLAAPDTPDVGDPPKEQWLRTLISLALALFDETVSVTRVEDRQIERVVDARRRLRRALMGGKYWSLAGLVPPKLRAAEREDAA